MTDEELKALCESNARAVQANSSAIGDLNRSMIGFRNEMGEFRSDLRSWVNTHNAISDDQGQDLAVLGDRADDTDARINALRADAVADRQAFREQAKAERQAFREALAADRAQWQANFDADREKADADRAQWQANFDADRAKADADRAQWQANFDAQQEILQRLLLEIRSTNGEVKQLGDRVDSLEQAS